MTKLPPLPREPKPSLLDLTEQMRRCTACPLHKSRMLVVSGEGPKKAKVMFIGEAPRVMEDRLGQPFVGDSGEYLNQMLKIAGLRRRSVFLTNAVKCHPQKNRDPTMRELKLCHRHWLAKQIEILKPNLIVLLGRSALRSLLGYQNVEPLHGRIKRKDGRRYFITFHPAAARRFPEIDRMMKEDFKRLKNLKK